jgi:hypothetical protein
MPVRDEVVRRHQVSAGGGGGGGGGGPPPAPPPRLRMSRLRDGQREAVVVRREHAGRVELERLDDLGVALEHGDGRGAGRQPEGRAPGLRGPCGDLGGERLDAVGDALGKGRARGPPEAVGRSRHAQHLGFQLGQSFTASRHGRDHRHAELAGERLGVHGAVVAARLVGEVHRDDHAEAEVEKLQGQVQAAAQIRGVDDRDHHVRLPGEQGDPRGALVAAMAVQ